MRTNDLIFKSFVSFFFFRIIDGNIYAMQKRKVMNKQLRISTGHFEICCYFVYGSKLDNLHGKMERMCQLTCIFSFSKLANEFMLDMEF